MWKRRVNGHGVTDNIEIGRKFEVITETLIS